MRIFWKDCLIPQMLPWNRPLFTYINLVANAGEGRKSNWAAKIEHLISNAQGPISALLSYFTEYRLSRLGTPFLQFPHSHLNRYNPRFNLSDFPTYNIISPLSIWRYSDVAPPSYMHISDQYIDLIATCSFLNSRKKIVRELKKDEHLLNESDV